MTDHVWAAVAVCLGFALQAYGTVAGLVLVILVGSWLVALARIFLG